MKHHPSCIQNTWNGVWKCHPSCPHYIQSAVDQSIKYGEPRISEFIELLDKMREIHLRKNQDYATNSNPFNNFEFSSRIIKEFNNDIDKVFVTLIATKLARLATLLNRGGIPQNESIEDSFLDLTVYCGLWASHYKRYTERNRSASIDLKAKPNIPLVVSHAGYHEHSWVLDPVNNIMVCTSCGFQSTSIGLNAKTGNSSSTGK